jgi:hypothetical protein
MTDLNQANLILNLALALRNNGSWAGETHIQKGSYFLNTLLNVPTGLNFILYKHGPFSFDLRELLTDMEAQGFIKWNSLPPYGPSIGEGPLGPLLREKFSTLSEQYKKQIEFVSRHLGHRNVASLERIATALYVSAHGSAGNSRVGKIVALKPHVDIVLAEKAVEELDKMKNDALNERLIPA